MGEGCLLAGCCGSGRIRATLRLALLGCTGGWELGRFRGSGFGADFDEAPWQTSVSDGTGHHDLGFYKTQKMGPGNVSKGPRATIRTCA